MKFQPGRSSANRSSAPDSTVTNNPSEKMNDSEAACFGAEALEYHGHCSVWDFVRLAVRPVNSNFDIFIRILFYLHNK